MRQYRPGVTRLDQGTTVELLEPRIQLSGSPAPATLAWSMYLGGSRGDTSMVAADHSGDAFVAGTTLSNDLAGASNAYRGGGSDAYVGKLDGHGNLLWMRYLGGSGNEGVASVTVDCSGNAILVGDTSSLDFVGANNSYHGGTSDVFVAKISPSGTVLWSTYLGGSSDGSIADSDLPFDLAVDRSGDVLVVGDTWTRDFSGAGPGLGGSFIAKVSSSGALRWARYFGNGYASIQSIAVDDAGGIVVAGKTGSKNLPNATNGNHIHNSVLGTVGDGFVSRLDDSGDVLWSTYVGGSESDLIAAVAIDRFGNAVVAGPTYSADLDAATNRFPDGLLSAFVAKVGRSGTLLWSTYVGSNGEDVVHGLALDDADNAWVVGEGAPVDLSGSSISYPRGNSDIYVAKISSAGRHLWSGYLGGSGADWALGMALGPEGDLWVSGGTTSTDFVDARNAYRGGTYDAFLAKLDLEQWIIGTAGNDNIHLSAATVTDPMSGQSVQGIQVTVNGVPGQPFVPEGKLLIDGQTGNDTITVDPDVSFPVLIYGGGGNDTISGGGGNDTIYGNTGDDQITAGEGTNSVLAGLGNDTLYGGSSADTLLGGNGSDLIYGQGGSDYIEGKGKADTLYGGSGNDTIYGGAGSDLIYGNAGDDWIDTGRSTIFTDTLSGGSGSDTALADPTDLLDSIETPILA